MRIKQRVLSLLLAGALLVPGLPAAEAAWGGADLGGISATVRVDWPQTLEALQDRRVRAELYQEGRSLGALDLTEEDGRADLGGYPAVVALRNQDGGELGGGRWPGYLDMSVSGLPQGNYTLEFTGDGYADCRQELTIDRYSQHVTLGTADASFTLGDVDGDGRVSSRDREELAEALGSAGRRDLERYDLNGDGVVDVYDLAIVSRNRNAEGRPEVRDTNLLAPPVEEIRLGEGASLSSGILEDLFRNNGQTVTLSGMPLELAVSLAEPVEMEEIRIVSPEGPEAMREGSVAVTYEDGSGETIPFDLSLPEGIRAIGPVEGSSVVKISLGRRVAVKEIVITVTRTEGGDYTTVESIQFLREIIPERPSAAGSVVRNLTAAAGSEKVSLRWSEVPNVSGYRVDYWLQDGSGSRRSLRVDVPRAEVTGLENLKTYLFTVIPVDGAWEGTACDPVSATPQPARAPSAPDMVSVSSLDSALSVGWKAAENATFYDVYYKAEDESGYRQWGGRLSNTSTVITDLTNGVTYSVYIQAGNSVGVSGPSRTALGTPNAVDYSRPEGIPAEGILEGADVERVWLADPRNVSPTAYPASKPFQPEYMNDGDFSTHWTSHAYGDGNWWNNKQVLASFSRPVDLSSVIWVPRLDGSYPNNLRLYTVTVWRQGDNLNGPGTLVSPNPLQGGSASDHNTWLPVGNNPAVTKFAVLPFEPVTDVVKIAVTIEQTAYTAVSLSELMFMEYDPARCLPDNITALFSDELRTVLRPGVTQADIQALRQRLESGERNYYMNLDTLADELDLAEELLRSGTSSGVVQSGVQSRSAGADAKYQQGGSDLQPLGVAAGAGQELTVYASGIPAGQKLTVYASQFNAEASAWRAEIGALSNGRNVLTVPQIGSQNTPRGGSLYLTYGGANPEGIRLHIRRGTDIPVLELADWHAWNDGQRRTELGRYVDELEAYAAGLAGDAQTNFRNVTEISTPTMLLSLPAAAVQSGAGRSRAERIETLYQAVLAWEDVMHICKTTQGIDKTYAQNDMRTRQNIRCMQMFAGAFMYAAGNHIGIGYGSCAGMVCGKPISSMGASDTANRLFGWGIAHEIGHNMDKLGKAEITNNLYALMVQTYDGKQNTLASRLEKSGKYPGIFTKTAQGLPGDSNDVFVQLGLYWQLHLAYDGGDKPMDFYNRFFKAWKAGTYFGGETNYQDRVARTASAVANRNLTEFFTRWGMTLSDGTKAELAKLPEETRALWYLSDQSRRDRLAGVSMGQGTVSLTAALEGEKAVKLTITSSVTQGKVQGYEILRNGVPIAFTTEAVYTDTIGSANHRTFAYSVRAYDTLGNRIAEASAPELRIAYDKTVPADAYDISRNGTTVTFTMKEETPVSGLKLTGVPASGKFTVTVTDKDGKTTTARSGDFGQGNQAVDDKSSYLTYFQKPGAEAADTRIWTYDAKTVVVTGVPENVAPQLISYAGDDVAFLENGAVGVLSKAYRYGTGAGQVIPAGTLIVTGTYRGDPAYQTVKIEGRFTRTVLTGEAEEVQTTTESRWLDGRALLFAEIPADGKVCDISDGLFIFIPNVQKEAELQGGTSACNAASLLPAQMRAVLSRTDKPTLAESQRVTAETLWINTPGGEDLPAIELEEGE
ncbi:M60 family metallopeptidase [uncultured Oscillibacter sp.]|uniref:M60 family metallopeptidase n=1 Tax=uncultured Oscillibacter sp. TaxID=876091 RepID=UPI00263374BF|nr:M60 family metallopeptidase [uncultured Oscillibacter sp.]